MSGGGQWERGGGDGQGPASLLPALSLPRSYLAIPATSWVDDFLDWLNPTGRCCRIYKFGNLTGQFCPSTISELGGRCGGRCGM